MKIIHIKDFFPPHGKELFSDDIESIIRSQYAGALAIMQHYANLPIVMENLSDDFPASHANADVVADAKELFPSGLPDKFDDLDSEQRDFIFQKGGLCTLLFIGTINCLYKSIDKSDEKIIQSLCRQYKYNAACELRAERTAKFTLEAARHFYKEQNVGNAAVIVWSGSCDDLKSYCDKVGTQHNLKMEYQLIDVTTGAMHVKQLSLDNAL